MSYTGTRSLTVAILTNVTSNSTVHATSRYVERGNIWERQNPGWQWKTGIEQTCQLVSLGSPVICMR
ncbi:hypothetical protein RRF57_001900 [Xylaria bambusicola]|uniref:Uncharacterized protein n=1 Tax=Xylaria bambusicola TaxID=326684 RepID=A0AAN7U657_9PEZI